MATIRRQTTPDATTQTNRGPSNRADSSRPARAPRGGALSRALTVHQRTKSAGIPKSFKPDVVEEVLALLEGDMIAGHYYHWVPSAEGKKSFLCLGNPTDDNFVGGDPDDERGCPLCKSGDKKIFKAYFNVVVLPDSGAEPEVAVMECGITLAGLIADYAESERIIEQGGLNGAGIYWAVGRKSTGEGASKKYTFSFRPVKERDLREDWGLDALTDDQITQLNGGLYTKSIVKQDTHETLAELVGSLHGA